MLLLCHLIKISLLYWNYIFLSLSQVLYNLIKRSTNLVTYPLMPFLFNDVKTLFLNLITIIYKDDFIGEYVNNVDGNYEIQFNNIRNFKRKVNIWSAANHLLNEKQYHKEIDEFVIVQFHKECSLFLVSILEKLKKRLLNGIQILKSASSLDLK